MSDFLCFVSFERSNKFIEELCLLLHIADQVPHYQPPTFSSRDRTIALNSSTHHPLISTELWVVAHLLLRLSALPFSQSPPHRPRPLVLYSSKPASSLPLPKSSEQTPSHPQRSRAPSNPPTQSKILCLGSGSATNASLAIPWAQPAAVCTTGTISVGD